MQSNTPGARRPGCRAPGVIGVNLAIDAGCGARLKEPGGMIDVAIMQSLIRGGVADDRVGGCGCGHVIFDECRHLSAPSFEAIARRVKSKYVLGLSATVTRKDGRRR